jgi:hypothetical protein
MRRFSFAQVRHYSFAVTHKMLILGTHGVVLRWFGFSGFCYF